MNDTSIQDRLERINVLKKEIAATRDMLRAEYRELRDILESLDSGVESLEAGARDIQSGIDQMSQFL